MQEEEYSRLKVAELKDFLTEFGLPTTGKKQELIDRLIEHSKKVAVVADSPQGGSSPLKVQTLNEDHGELTIVSPDKPAISSNASASGQIKSGQSSAQPAAQQSGQPSADIKSPQSPKKAQKLTGAAPAQNLEDLAALDEEARRKKRAERFGIPYVPLVRSGATSTKVKSSSPYEHKRVQK